MLAAITPNQFDLSSVIISPRSDNNVIHGTYFYRYQYAHCSCMLSGVYLVVNIEGLRNTEIETHPPRQAVSQLAFDPTQNQQLIDQISKLEKSLLELVGVHSNIEALQGITGALQSGVLRNVSGILSEKPGSLILRISGVWEDAAQYGLVYRFIIPSRPL